ncbi:ATP-binding protein [Streptomyces sp. NPDC057611]|uniref:ATP-binding protein n=1 Tax=Streptomyces sp. NPDC057611 TaxID=3346182 RepID=UPI0036958087
MDGFIGRRRELDALSRMLRRAATGGRGGRPGRAVLMRGRRRVGKSRLAEEFLERAQVPYLFFTASAQPTARADLALFAMAARSSPLTGDAFRGQEPQDWDAALHLLAGALPADRPSVVVLDEIPYLIAKDPGFEGTLQKMFDRELSKRPVLLICIGSDLAMMEALNEYGRPFHQRATEMVVPPLGPAEVAEMLDLPAAEAFDAYVTGGLPLVLDEWPGGAGVFDYLEEAVADPTSALLVSGERALAAEFPTEALARQVLTAIGAGERSYSLIGRAAGGLPQASLSRALHLLTAKRVVDAVVPLSTKPSKETRYLVADPHLRFWLAFLGPHMAEIERGRGDLVLARIRTSWTAWRGRAVEPVVREALLRMPPGQVLSEDTGAVGGYWTRTNDPEIDIVAADRGPVAKRITAVGSVKWLENRPFDSHDLARLLVHRSQLPGASDTTLLLAVARSGCTVEGLTAIGPQELLDAW